MARMWKIVENYVLNNPGEVQVKLCSAMISLGLVNRCGPKNKLYVCFVAAS